MPMVQSSQMPPMVLQPPRRRLAVAAASADEITELVALPPADGASSTSQVLKWVKVTYPSAVTTCSDVTMEDATGSPELGAWDGLDLGRCLTEQ